MKIMTKGQMEAEISEVIIKFERECMGKGPTEIKTNILKDAVFVRLNGVLTLAEEQLAKTSDGADMIKEMRIQLLESAGGLLKNTVEEITGCSIVSFHSDLCTRTGDKIIVFTLDRDLEI
jgi:uncharacterized protein YbcI